MGSSTSKAARKFPKPSWAGARTPSVGEQAGPRPLASEVKNEAIERDAQDPHFMANLNRLGAVRVDHHMQTIRTAGNTAKLFESRNQAESEAFAPQPARNHLHGATLSNLLDARKAVKTWTEQELLAERFGIDVPKLKSLTRFVSTPSVQAGSASRTVDKDGQETITMEAVWIEPRIAAR